MMEAVDKLENSPSVTSARLHDTTQFDVDVTASKVVHLLHPAVPARNEQRTPLPWWHLEGTNLHHNLARHSVRFQPMQGRAGREHTSRIWACKDTLEGQRNAASGLCAIHILYRLYTAARQGILCSGGNGIPVETTCLAAMRSPVEECSANTSEKASGPSTPRFGSDSQAASKG